MGIAESIAFEPSTPSGIGNHSVASGGKTDYVKLMMIPLANLGSFMGVDGLIIFFVVLLLFGAKKLPELARGLGQSLNEFKKAREDIEGEFKAGQQDLTPRGAVNRQPYGQDPSVAVPTQALTYNQQAAGIPSDSEQALQQQVAELQKRLHAMEAEKREETSSAN